MQWSSAARLTTAGGGFVWAARRARRLRVSAAEEQVFRTFNDAPDQLHGPAWLVMQAGSLGAVFVVAAAEERHGNRAQALATVVVGTGVWGSVKLIKPLVGRGRPDRHLDEVAVRGAPQTGLGFPSGHAAVATTIALLGGRSPRARQLALMVAAVTGGARMYVGAHLPLDVLGGYALGVAASELSRAWLSGR